jgi:hypothetical protein
MGVTSVHVLLMKGPNTHKRQHFNFNTYASPGLGKTETDRQLLWGKCRMNSPLCHSFISSTVNSHQSLSFIDLYPHWHPTCLCSLTLSRFFQYACILAHRPSLLQMLRWINFKLKIIISCLSTHLIAQFGGFNAERWAIEHLCNNACFGWEQHQPSTVTKIKTETQAELSCVVSTPRMIPIIITYVILCLTWRKSKQISSKYHHIVFLFGGPCPLQNLIWVWGLKRGILLYIWVWGDLQSTRSEWWHEN